MIALIIATQSVLSIYYTFFPLTHLITGSSTTLLLQEAQEHLCCVIIIDSSYRCAVLIALQWTNDDQTAEIMLTSLSGIFKAISGDAPFFFFFFYIAGPLQIDACCVQLCLSLNSKRAQEVKCCSQRSIYLDCEAVFPFIACSRAPIFFSAGRKETRCNGWTTAHPVPRLWVWTWAIFCNHSTV